MSLRTRLFVIFSVVIAALLAVGALIDAEIVRPGFQQLEEAEAGRNLLRLHRAVQREAETIDLTTADWANWDDSHAFVQDGNEAYRTSNLVPTLLEQLNIHLMFILDRDGRTVHGRTRDPESGEDTALADFPQAGLGAGHPLLRNGNAIEPLVGLVRTGKGVLLLSARPIRHSDQSGPSAGTFLMGRFLNAEAVATLSRLVQLDVTALTLPLLTGADAAVAATLRADGDTAVAKRPDGRLVGHVLMADLWGKPALLLRADMSLELADSARRTVLWSLAAAGLGGTVLLAVLLLATGRLVVAPLNRLLGHVQALRRTGDLSARLNLPPDGEIGDLAAAFDDLTDTLSRTARERDQAQARLLDGVQCVADGFALWDAEDRLVVCNSTYATSLPMVADIIRPGVSFLEVVTAVIDRGQIVIDPEQRQAWLARRLREHRMPGPPIEYRTADGRWIEVRERQTSAGGIVGVYSDATGRKAAEAQLHAMLGELERSNADLEQFAYVASHDLQEPLRQVASYTQLLERRYADKLDADAREFIAYAVDGAKRMQQQINDVLSYALVNRRGQSFTIIDSGEAVGAAIANLQGAIGESTATVTAAPLPVVRGDRAMITQLFQNLIGNAIKYAQPGVAPVVTIGATPVGERWHFTVKDNGIGFEADYADRIFRIFQRLHTRERYSGNGIGLAICKRIVERHDGTIWAESQPGQGSVFHFTLPAIEAGTESAVDAMEPA